MSLVRNALLITLVGMVVGLMANGLSPRGISLMRDYFSAERSAKANGAIAPITSPANAIAADHVSTQQARSKRGLPLIGHDEVVAWFRDPRYKEQRIIFVDARDDAHFSAGHIPGAHPFDHYHMEQHVAPVLAAAQLAERIVVYCNGGDCEDSELATLDLISLGIPEAKLVIYGGGIAEWTKHGLPLESKRAP